MFKIDQILKRAWQILWNYKILWVFGLLLTLTGAGSRGGGGNGGSGYRSSYSGGHETGNFPSNLENAPWAKCVVNWFNTNFGRFFDTPQHIWQSILVIFLIIVGFSLLVNLILALVRYPAETALIRMVDEHETSGTKRTFKQGWSLGWDRRAFNMWLIDLIISVPIFIIVMGFLVLMGFNIYQIILTEGARSFAVASFAGIILLLILFMIPFMLFCAALNVLREYVVRFAAIEGENVGASFAKGWAFFKHNFKNTLLIWLVLIGVGIVAGIALMLAALILIPTYALMAIPGAVVAAIPGAIGYGITSLINPQVWPWVIGALLAIPFFFAITFSPISFVSGWVTIFTSNVWTLTFRQLKALSQTPPPFAEIPPSVPEQSSLTE